jgi:lysophospholipase L1-like esterase
LNFYKKIVCGKLILFLIILSAGGSQIYSQKVKILPLGDSITNGESPQPDSLFTGYRQPLWLLLQSDGYPVDFIGSDTAGYAAYPKYDYNNAGFGGYTKKQILNLIETGYDAHGNAVTPGPYLNYYHANVILLHEGTNAVDTSTADVINLLNYIDNFEDTTNSVIWVILAKIINEVPYSLTTTIYNENLEKMADERIKNGDHIKLVDMENNAGLVYNIDTVAPYINGDMHDHLHPNNKGYAKIASLFYDTLSVLLNQIIPVELTSFSSVVSNDSVTLHWQTALELNNYGFVIERSSNNNVWENIGFVAGADNSYNLNQYQFTDTPAQPNTYLYRIRQIENNGSSKYIAQIDVRMNTIASAADLTDGLPKEFRLDQNYPNPFNPTTVIRYELSKESMVSIKIYNTLGQLVSTLVNKTEYPGVYEKTWDGSSYSSGAYFYVMNISSDNGANQLHFTKKMILIK